jgi:hypothetical protein
MGQETGAELRGEVGLKGSSLIARSENLRMNLPRTQVNKARKQGKDKRYEFRTTKPSELRFRALVGDNGTRNVRFEQAV